MFLMQDYYLQYNVFTMWYLYFYLTKDSKYFL